MDEDSEFDSPVLEAEDDRKIRRKRNLPPRKNKKMLI